MTFKELELIAAEEIGMILKVLPSAIQEQTTSLVITYQAKPEDEELDEETLGLFEGNSLLEDPDPASLPRIRLFLENLWEYADGEMEDFRDEVGTTFLHELGHYLGWDEDELEQKGLG